MAGLVAVLFIRTLAFFEDLFEKSPVPVPLQAALGGIVVGGIGVFLPQDLRGNRDAGDCGTYECGGLGELRLFAFDDDFITDDLAAWRVVDRLPCWGRISGASRRKMSCPISW